jgi:DMSO/TMAO reductase YedYZ molybdopterin-dependent catalytic subunit
MTSSSFDQTEDAGEPGVPPGQRVRDTLLVKHYGPVPKANDPDSWAMVFAGATASAETERLTVGQLAELPQTRVVADLHCASKWSVRNNVWDGVLARDLLEIFPPDPAINEVIVYGHYGYSANVQLSDLVSDQSLLATRLNGEPLTPEHGFPVRLIVPHLYSYKGPKWFRGWEYLREPRRGFWEERGYHLNGDPWNEERYSYQETHPRPPGSSADR